MKNIQFISTFLIAGLLFSCKKNISSIYFEGGTPPQLSASTTTISLEPGTEANTAIILKWTNPDYKFTTGLSSQDVVYTLEMDTLGANFSSSKKVSTVISKDLSKTYTVGQLNTILGNDMVLQLNPRRNYTLQLRVISSIGSAVKLVSNVVSFTTKPFAPPPKVVPPTAGTLWITGDAVGTAGFPAWSNPIPSPYDVSLKFTQVSTTLYELVVDLKTTGGYKLIQTQGNWDTQYHMVAGGTALAGSFVQENADPTFPAPSVAGSYKLTFDFQLGKYTAVKQ